MDPRDFLLILVVAVPCGALAQTTSAFARKGWLMHFGLAYIGGFLGILFARSVDVPVVYLLSLGVYKFPIIWALVGSALAVAGVGLLVKPGR